MQESNLARMASAGWSQWQLYPHTALLVCCVQPPIRRGTARDYTSVKMIINSTALKGPALDCHIATQVGASPVRLLIICPLCQYLVWFVPFPPPSPAPYLWFFDCFCLPEWFPSVLLPVSPASSPRCLLPPWVFSMYLNDFFHLF